jgi:thiamine biosynthesis lipoprotein
MTGAIAGTAVLSWTGTVSRTLTAFEWRGGAMGAEARIVLYHDDRAKAEAIVTRVVDEIDRLEQELSLFRSDSALARLNRDGCLPRPSLDMRQLLATACSVSAASGGAFDISIQPLWDLYARWFRGASPPSAAPSPAAVEKAAALVDYRRIDIGPAAIRLEHPGMALTLNGIAQGYIADRAAMILRDAGLTHVLVDAGELRAVSRRADGKPWLVRLDHPQETGPTIELADSAVATSSGFRARFTPDGLFNHLVDPRSRRCPEPQRAVSVVASSATLADALSTALCLLPGSDGAALLQRFEPTRVTFHREACAGDIDLATQFRS